MNSKHTKTLQAVFSKATPTALEWAKLEALLIAVGCQVIEGRGSRVRFAMNGKIATLHRPHPTKEAKPYQVEHAREFLTAIGIKP